MAQILVRALDANWDVMRGAGVGSFVTDIYAVAQIIKQRILLLQQEWYESLTDGTPLYQQILGVSTSIEAVTLILRQRILSAPFVTGINSLSVNYAAAGRNFTFSASVATQFGSFTISTIPNSQAVAQSSVSAPLLFDSPGGTFDELGGTFDNPQVG